MKIEIHKSKNSQFYWRLVAVNRHVLATSETYTRKEKAQRTANGLVNNGLNAEVIDLTLVGKPAPRKKTVKKKKA